jgi:hypothetical protein
MAGDATAYTCDEEVLLWMLCSILSESLNCSFQTHETFHRWDGVTLTLESFTLTPYSTELAHGCACSTSGMETAGVTAEDEYLVGAKRLYSGGSHFLTMVFASELAFALYHLLVIQTRFKLTHHI